MRTVSTSEQPDPTGTVQANKTTDDLAKDIKEDVASQANTGQSVKSFLGLNDPWTEIPNVSALPDWDDENIDDTDNAWPFTITFEQVLHATFTSTTGGSVTNNGEVWNVEETIFDGTWESITNTGDIIYLRTDDYEYAIRGSVENLDNSGTISLVSTRAGSAGILYSETNTNVNNEGVIEVWTERNYALGFRLAEGGDITNSGSLVAEGAFFGAYGIVFGFDGSPFYRFASTIDNSGEITAYANAGDAYAILSHNTQVSIVNSGEITASSNDGEGYAIVFNRPGFEYRVAELDNSGLIDADYAAIDVRYVTNSGTINGNIVQTDFNDTIVNTGNMNGDLDLGDGNDLFESSDGIFTGSVDGGAGQDTIRGSSQNETLEGGRENDLIRGGDGSDYLAGETGNDTIWAGADDTGDDTLDGGDGRDMLAGGAGNDVILGGLGIDTLFGGDGNDLLYGDAANGGGDNNIIWAGNGADYLRGSGGDDILGGGLGNDTIEAGGGDDIIYGGNDSPAGLNDIINAGGGNDIVYAGGGDDSLAAGSGDDDLYSGAGNDTVDGGAGDDTLWGGGGDDVFTGGEGVDIFYFGGTIGNDTVIDFNVDQDQLNLSATVTDFNTHDDITAAASDTDDGLRIDLGDGNSLLLEGLTTDDIADMAITF